MRHSAPQPPSREIKTKDTKGRQSAAPMRFLYRTTHPIPTFTPALLSLARLAVLCRRVCQAPERRDERHQGAENLHLALCLLGCVRGPTPMPTPRTWLCARHAPLPACPPSYSSPHPPPVRPCPRWPARHCPHSGQAGTRIASPSQRGPSPLGPPFAAAPPTPPFSPCPPSRRSTAAAPAAGWASSLSSSASSCWVRTGVFRMFIKHRTAQHGAHSLVPRPASLVCAGGVLNQTGTIIHNVRHMA